MHRPRPARAIGVLLLSLLLLPAACGRSSKADAKPRLVVLYAPCSLRCGSLEPYDSAIPFTPNLAAFARDSVVFEKHDTESPESGIAYASIFTGSQADRHKVFHHPSVLKDGVPTIARTFAENGYECWFWAGHPMANGVLNYGQGVPAERIVTSTGRDRPKQWVPGRAETMTANDARMVALLDDLAAHPEKRAYVQVDFTLCHDPYEQFCSKEDVAKFLKEFQDRAPGLTAEDVEQLAGVYAKNYGEFQWNYDAVVKKLGLGEEDRRKLAAALQTLYETDVHELDRWYGAFLEKIRAHGLEEESVIAFTADHGEALDRQNLLFRWGHGVQLVPETVRVPFLVRAPGRLKAQRYPGVTRSIDVYPTLAGICGIGVPIDSVQGLDLSPALRGERPPPELLAFSHTMIPNAAQSASLLQYEGVRTWFPSFGPDQLWVRVESDDVTCKLQNVGDGKFGFTAFDSEKDPFEEHDLFDAQNSEHAQLAKGLEEYKATLIEASTRAPEAHAAPTEEDIRRMQGLGYVR